MERCKLTAAFLTTCISLLKLGYEHGNAKSRKWVAKWQPQLRNGSLFYQNKELIPEERTEAVMTHELMKNGMPLSRDATYQYLRQKYFGFKRAVIDRWMKSLEVYQLTKLRPHKNQRVNLKAKVEGAAQILMSKKYGGHFNWGVDLFYIPQETKTFPKGWSKNKYLYVAVCQSTNFCYAYAMTSKTAQQASSKVKRLFADCKKDFGMEPSGVCSDAGTEFLGAHDQYLFSKGINRNIVSKAWWVERRISILARYLGALIDGLEFDWQESLRLALEKTNNTYCRKIKGLPSEFTGDQISRGVKHFNKRIPKRAKVRKQPTFKKLQRVRHLLKPAGDVNQVHYKSYQGYRDPKSHIWSRTIFTIENKRKKGRIHQYFVNKKWRYPFELQLITGTPVILQKAKKVRPKQKPKPRVRDAHAEIDQGNVLRRSTRLRVKPKYYGR